jgi:hypothetical protein
VFGHQLASDADAIEGFDRENRSVIQSATRICFFSFPGSITSAPRYSLAPLITQ